MPKYIREGRFGAPKTWKTGSILGNAAKGIKSYPQPIGVLEFDPGGHEVCPDVKLENVISAAEFEKRWKGYKEKPTDPVPNITIIDLSFKALKDLEDTYLPSKDAVSFKETVKVINLLRQYCPFKTILVDPVTELSNAIYRHQAVENVGSLADARKWAGNIGAKVQQVIEYVCALPCNAVFLFHTEIVTVEETKRIYEQPMVYSKLRDYVGGKFTQYFYQQVINGAPKLRTKPFELVSGIGCRWPTFTTETVDPTFEAIYGKETDVYK
jgi:hypothetical protein